MFKIKFIKFSGYLFNKSSKRTILKTSSFIIETWYLLLYRKKTKTQGVLSVAGVAFGELL